MTSPIEHSLKARIRSIAREQRLPPESLWENLVLERFLVRLSRSRYANNFILKGGVLLSKYLPINRHTQDLDFLVRNLSNSVEELEKIVLEIASMNVGDGFAFDQLEVGRLPHPHMKYAGVRANMMAFFGRIRFKVAIDMGFGDIVWPVQRPLPLLEGPKGALFESHVEMRCYPKEFILAEKLESMVFLGMNNSRVKDYHDVYTLVTAENALSDRLEEIVQAVFEHRQTLLKLPIDHSEESQAAFQELWNSHLNLLREGHSMPSSFQVVVDTINKWLNENTALIS